MWLLPSERCMKNTHSHTKKKKKKKKNSKEKKTKKTKKQKQKKKKNKQIPWGIYVPRLIFIWGVKNGKVNQRTTGPVSNT